MEIYEKVCDIERERFDTVEKLINYYKEKISSNVLDIDETLVRFVVSNSRVSRETVHETLELGILKGTVQDSIDDVLAVRRYKRRSPKFNIVFLIPTGINALIGGHSGDGGAMARLFCSTCDNFLTHPNVVNAADINELPENGWYVEGSIINRFLMGQIGLVKPKSNRICVVVYEHEEKYLTDSAMNAINAARASMGINVPLVLKSNFDMKAYLLGEGSSGRAVGLIKRFDKLLHTLWSCYDSYDAIAITSPIKITEALRNAYWKEDKDIPNPWGGVEAMLTHAVSGILNKQSAHAPQQWGKEILDYDYGVVDPRKAAETVSVANFHCVLKGLHTAPRVINGDDLDDYKEPGVLTVADIDAVVMPYGCIGIPTLASMYHKIPLIMVEENTNVLRNDVSAYTNVIKVSTYFEAIGVLAAIKSGIGFDTLARPMPELNILNIEEEGE